MDYTKVPRPLIYRDRSDVSEFLDDSAALKELNRDFYGNLIERPFIDRVDDAASVVLAIFNNAYYIATLIGMTPFPELDLKKYLDITHNGYGKCVEWVNHASPATMALVLNLLYCFKKDSASDKIARKIHASYKDWDMMATSEGKEDFYSLLRNYEYKSKNVEEVMAVLAPCTIDAQTIADADEFLFSHSSDWGRLTDGFSPKRIDELLSICRNEDERSLLSARIAGTDEPDTDSRKEIEELRMRIAELERENVELKEEAIESPRQKIRIELLNFLFKKLGCDTKWITENRKATAVAKVYAAIMGHNNPKGLAKFVGKVNYGKRPQELDGEIERVNELLRDIHDDWKIEL